MTREYRLDLTGRHKLIVGEGESDRNFFAEFCWRNSIEGFDYGFAGMHNPKYRPSGFDRFTEFLVTLHRLSGFNTLTDLVLVHDSTDEPDRRLNQLRRQIRDANRALGDQVYTEDPNPNVVSNAGRPRLHVLRIPVTARGGLESICFIVARESLDNSGHNGTEKEGWVDRFANSACVGWTTEKRDKLRLQALISAAWEKKPEMHFSQLFDITGDQLVPLDGSAFEQIRNFLQTVATL